LRLSEFTSVMNMPTRKLNKRFALLSAISVVVLCTCTYFVHGYQVRKNASALMSRAEHAQEEGDLSLSADYYRRYLGFVPSDAEALGRYGLLLSDPKFAKTKRNSYAALQILEKALRSDPGRLDLRRSVVRLSVDLGLFVSARDDLNNYLIPAFPDDGELKALLAQSNEGSGLYKEARDEYRHSIRLAPQVVDTYCKFATLLRRHTKEVLRDKEGATDIVAKADEVMAAMVSANQQNYRAYLLRAEYRLEFAQDKKSTLEAVAGDVSRALELEPSAADVLVAGAQVFAQQGKIDDARALLRRGCQLHPKDWRIYKAQARLESNDEKPEAALTALRDGLNNIPNHPDLLWNLADLLTSLGRKDEVTKAVADLELAGVRPSDLDCFRARLLMRDEQWWEAAKILEHVVPLLAGRGVPGSASFLDQQIIQAGLLLGRCCEQLGDFHRAKAAYGRVIAQDSRSIPGRLGMATTLVSLGQSTEALDQYRQLTRLTGAPAVAWVEIARLLLVRNLERNETRRDWIEVENAIRQAEQIVPLPVEVVGFHVELLAARKQFDEARQIILEKYPEPKSRPADVWVAMASLEKRLGRDKAAAAVLDEAEKHLEHSPELHMARARFLVGRGIAETSAGISSLAEGLDRFESGDRLRLLNGLAALAMQSGDSALAGRLWGQLAKERPNDLPCQLGLFDVAAQTNDATAMQDVISRLKQIEGEDGIMWRFARASVLVSNGIRGDKSGLIEARALLGAVAVRRPDWSRLALCQAQLDDLEGDRFDAALAGYQRALQLGDRDPLAFRRTIEMLYERNRFSEAYDLMKKLPDQATLPLELTRIGAELLLYSKDKDSAQKLADTAAAKNSADYRDHLWLGRFYYSAGRIDHAGAEFERARELATNEPVTWVALVQFHAATGNNDRARAETEAAKSRLSQGIAAGLALACCYEAIGAMDQAKAQYETTVASAPSDVTIVWCAANFYCRNGELSAAEPLLRRLMDPKSQSPAIVAWARRNLAIIVAVRGDPTRRSEALALLAPDAGTTISGNDVIGEQRARATVLTMQIGQQYKREAVKILESLIDRRVAIPEDYFLAAQLHEALGDWQRARLRYLGYVEQPGAGAPANLFIVARGLLRHGNADEARPLVRQIQANASGAKSFESQEFQARLLHAEGKASEAVALILSYARLDGAKLPSAAALLAELDAHSAAEDLYRLNAERSGRPNDTLMLARYLVDRKKCVDAIELCDRVWADAAPLAVADIAVAALAKSSQDQRLVDRVERRINESIKNAPDSAALIAALAAVRNFQGRFDEAEQLYRRALDLDARLDVALNNLAWLLSLRGGGGANEALVLLRRAVDVSGLDPGLLDTRGVAYMALKQGNSIDLAIEDLKSATEESPNPATYFHLAQAYTAVGRRKEASQAWRNAKALGLSAEVLHPLERSSFERLARELN
jgi:cellulose synthase operon protein C